MKNPLLSCRNLHLAYGDNAILKGLSLDLYPREHVAIIGTNGAGKSSLLQSLSGIRNLSASDTSNMIFLGDRCLSEYSRRELARSISWLPQSITPIPPFTVIDFVRMARYAFSDTETEEIAQAEYFLSLTGMSEFRHRTLKTLSGGERQRVYLAAAFCQTPSILLLDEPTSYLDPKQEQLILSLLASVQSERNMTIVHVTHDINTALLLADRVVAMANGKVAFQGTCQKMIEENILETIFERRFTFVSYPGESKKFIIPEPIS